MIPNTTFVHLDMANGTLEAALRTLDLMWVFLVVQNGTPSTGAELVGLRKVCQHADTWDICVALHTKRAARALLEMPQGILPLEEDLAPATLGDGVRALLEDVSVQLHLRPLVLTVAWARQTRLVMPHKKVVFLVEEARQLAGIHSLGAEEASQRRRPRRRVPIQFRPVTNAVEAAPYSFEAVAGESIDLHGNPQMVVTQDTFTIDHNRHPAYRV